MSRLFRKKILPLLLAALLCFTAGCGGNGGGDDGTDSASSTAVIATPVPGDGTFGLFYNPNSSMNPYDVTDANNLLICGFVYQNFLTVNNDFQLEPNCVSEWSTTDGRVWSLKPNTEKAFPDGKALDANDLDYSFQCAIGSGRYESRFVSHVDATYVTEDGRLEITLSFVDYLFPYLLDIPVVENGTYSAAHPSGTGPFQFASDGNSLVANPKSEVAEDLQLSQIHFETYSSTDELNEKFESGTVDMILNDPTVASTLGLSNSNELREYNTTNLHYIGFNLLEDVFSDYRLQQAFENAVDRDYMADTIMEGNAMAAYTPIHPASPLNNKTLESQLAYNLTTFKSELDAMGAKDTDGDGVLEYQSVPLSFTLLVCKDSSEKLRFADKFASDMKNYGVEIKVNALEWSAYREALFAGNFDMYYAEIRIPADFDLSCILAGDGAGAFNQKYDAQNSANLSAFLAAPDDTRQAACNTMCQHIIDTGCIIPVCFEKHQIIFRYGTVKNMSLQVNGPSVNISQWELHL